MCEVDIISAVEPTSILDLGNNYNNNYLNHNY